MNASLNFFNLQNTDASNAAIYHEPFPFMVAHGVLNSNQQELLAQDFPAYTEAGYFPYYPEECGPAISALIDEVTSPAVADQLGAQLGIENLSKYPVLVTICKHLNRRHGTIHTDSLSKVATALIYMNDRWDGTSDGCLRFLASSDNIENTLVPEVPPLFGSCVMFKRTECSYHGHLPYEGERRVIQIAWVVNEKERDRKIKRGRFTRWVKSLFGGLDRQIGRDRDVNKGHLN